MVEFLGGGPLSGKIVVAIQKCDNGFIVNLVEAPKMPEKAKSADPDVEIDELIDGIIAMNKHFAGGIDGEEWREGSAGDKRRVREAFKKISPGLMHQLQPCPQPRMEMKVFATKQELFAYLSNNL
jgi:hypothetical protein